MFKSRNFFTGFGIGLILSSILIFFSSSPADILLNKDISIEQLKESADKQNLILYTTEELDLVKTKVKEEVLNDMAAKEDIKPEELIYFAIPNGMTSSNAADYLFEIGLLNDKSLFQQILNDNNLTKNIIAKTYKYQENLSVEELIELITGKKKETWQQNQN